MPTQKKVEMVAEITENLGTYAGFYVINYCGLTVKQMSALRGELRNVEAKCVV